jgi:hypothetical protein
MAWLGLVPSEYSSGLRKRQGAITKCGNGFARRLLIEAPGHIAIHRKSVRASRSAMKESPDSSSIRPGTHSCACANVFANSRRAARRAASRWCHSPRTFRIHLGHRTADHPNTELTLTPMTPLMINPFSEASSLLSTAQPGEAKSATALGDEDLLTRVRRARQAYRRITALR